MKITNKQIKQTAYKKILSAHYGNASPVWDPHTSFRINTMDITQQQQTTLQRIVSSAPFWESGKQPEKMAAAECKSILDLLPEDLSLSCLGEGNLTQRSKRQGYRFFVCAMPFSWFLFCHVKHRQLTTCIAMARKLARPFQALSAKHVGALLYSGTRLAET